MRRAFSAPLAVIFGVLVVTAGAFGAVSFTDPSVDSFGDFTDEYVVQDADAFGGIVTMSVLGAVTGAAVGTAIKHFLNDGTVNKSKLDGLDALETKKALHTSAATKAQDWRTFSQTMDNYLNDTRSIALMEGKNAYIKALNNGSSEAAARNAAAEAVADYYAVKQRQVIASWNATATLFNHSYHVAENTSEIDHRTFLDFLGGGGGTDDYPTPGTGTQTVTLVNGTQVSSLTYTVNWGTGTATVAVTTGDTGVSGVPQEGIQVRPPNQNYDSVKLVDFSQYLDIWNRIETQNSEVQNQLDAFVDATYQDYVAGEINSSQLVDPYLGAREYSPEAQFSTWALRTMASIGVEPPQNLSNIGKMVIETPGYSYTGILMSADHPTGGFAIGTEYNASALNGSQWIITEDGQSVELTSTFTIASAETADGEQYTTNETIVYKDVNYGTTNTSEYQALLQNLTELTAQINAWQQKERSAGGGGGLFGGLGLGPLAGLGIGGTVLLAAGGYLALAGRRP